MDTPCPNCHGGTASHVNTTEELLCILCGVSVEATMGRQKTLANLVAARFRELRFLMDTYEDLVKLHSLSRVMMIPRLRRCIDDIAAMEAIPPESLPVGDLQLWAGGDNDDYDEGDDGEEAAREALG